MTPTSVNNSAKNHRNYPSFGMVMSGRSFTSDAYRYGFNGKEQDNEGMGGGGSTYDYGFRIYNAGIAKFLSVDPLTASYPWYTPYQFAGNKPIWCLDLDGLEELKFNDKWISLTGKSDIEKQTILDVNEKFHRGNLTVDQINKYWKPGEYWTVSSFTTDNIPAGTEMKKYNSKSDYNSGKSSYDITLVSGIQKIGSKMGFTSEDAVGSLDLSGRVGVDVIPGVKINLQFGVYSTSENNAGLFVEPSLTFDLSTKSSSEIIVNGLSNSSSPFSFAFGMHANSLNQFSRDQPLEGDIVNYTSGVLKPGILPVNVGISTETSSLTNETNNTFSIDIGNEGSMLEAGKKATLSFQNKTSTKEL